jgi:hypothetical protein
VIDFDKGAVVTVPFFFMDIVKTEM